MSILTCWGYEETKLPSSSQEMVPFGSLSDLSRLWGVSWQNIRRKIRRWLDNQEWARWRGLASTQRRDRELISGPSLSAKTRHSFFKRTKSRVVIGLLNGHNILRRHLHFMRLIVPYVGGVEYSRKHLPTFSVCVRFLSSLKHVLYIWVPFSWIQEIIRV